MSEPEPNEGINGARLGRGCQNRRHDNEKDTKIRGRADSRAPHQGPAVYRRACLAPANLPACQSHGEGYDPLPVRRARNHVERA
jgi:hypothetical protein